MILLYKKQESLWREWQKLVVRSVEKINQKYINKIVKKALMEDLSPKGDVTTNLISYKNKIITARIISKQNGIISGLNFCKAAFKLIGKEVVFSPRIKDGKK